MKTQHRQPLIAEQLNAIYPPWQREPVISSASRALIDQALREDLGIGAGRHIAVALSLAALISVIPSPALAAIGVNDGHTTNNKILAGIDYVDSNDDVSMEIYSGGLATNTTIHKGGSIFVSSGGNATSSTINYMGAQHVSSGGSASFTTLNYFGEEYINLGGRTSATTINSGGKEYLYSGGQAISVSQNVGGNIIAPVYGGDTQTVANGSNVSGNFSLSNGSANGFILYGDKNWYVQEIFSGGIATNTTLSGGTQDVNSGGSASNTTVHSGGVQNVSGGYASSTTVNSSGLQQVIAGGSASATIINRGGGQIVSNASVTSATINSSGVQAISSGGSASSTTVNSGGAQQVKSGGSAIETTISGIGSFQSISAKGEATSTTINSGGVQDILDGGTATSTSVSSGGRQQVRSGANALSTTISGDSSYQLVLGSATSATIHSGGVQLVYAEGSAVSTAISGGRQQVNSGGNASATTVNNRGGQIILGTAVNTTISGDGSFQLVSSGGSATSTRIDSGGTQVVFSGGMATDTNVAMGAALSVDAGGLLAGTLAVDSGGLLEGMLTLTNGSNLAGHILIADSASLQTLASNDTLNLAGSATQLVYAKTSAATLNANLSGTGGLIQQGSDTLTLTGNNNYSGATSVISGTLVGNIASGTALNVSASGRYEAGDADRTLSTLNGAGTVDMQSHNLTASSGSFIGTLIGTTDLTKIGNGTLSFNSATHLAGDLKVNAGTLALGQTLTANGTAVFASDTTLDLASTTQITAGNVTIGDHTTLDVQTMSGMGSVTLIESTGSSIDGNFTTVKIAGVQLSSNVCDLEHFFDSASVVVQKTSDDKIIQMSNDGLIWNHVNEASAHGNFNVATQFTLTDSLVDNTINTAYAFGWDGKTLVKTGQGTLTLTGNNTYTGATQINSGRLKGHIATGTSLIIAAGAAYDAGDEDHSIGSLSGEGTVDMHDHNLTVGSGTFNGSFTDAHDLIKTGSGTLTLNTDANLAGELAINAGTVALASNTHAEALALNAGTLVLSENKVLSVAGNATLGDGSTLDLAGHAKLVAGNVAINSGATLDIEEQVGATPVSLIEALNAPISGNFGSILVAGVAINLGSPTSLDHFLKDVSVQKTSDDKVIQMSAGGLLWSNTAPSSAHGTFNVATQFTLTDSLVDNTINTAYAFGWDGKTLVKTGQGTLTLTGNNTYTGATQINSGRLKGHIATGTSLIIAAGAAYDAGDEDHSIGSLSGEGTVDMHDHNLTVGSGTFNGSFTDAHDLIKTGSGTLTLNTDANLAGELAINAGTVALASNTHAEALALNAGTLVLSENKVLSVAGNATLGDGSTLDLAGHAKLVAGNVAINSGATLDIEEQVGATPVSLIEALNAPISGNFGSILVAGVAINLGSPTSLDHFLKDVSVQKTSDDKVIQMSAGGLLWSNTAPSSAHGTFNVATQFTLTDSLVDNTTNTAYAFSWDGKTLTKVGDGALILTGTYMYTGKTKIEAGTLVLDGQKGAGSLIGDIIAVSGTAFQIINGGHFTGSIDPTDVTLSGSTSRWDITGSSIVDNLTLVNGGKIGFAPPSNANPYKTLTINGKLNGNGEIIMNTHLAARQGDQIKVYETAGTQMLTINDAGGVPSSVGQSLKLIDVSAPGLSNGVFILRGGHVDAGAFRYFLAKGAETPLGDAGDWYLYSAGTASRLSEQSLVIAGNLKYTALASLGTLQERLGELRLDETGKNSGLWLRTYHQDYDNQLYSQATGRQKISGLMLGIDQRLDNVSDTGRVTVGALFGYGQSDFTAKEQGGQIDSTDYQLGAYATWQGNQGSYMDLVARILWLDRDYRFDQSNAAQEKASGKRLAHSFALELGHRIDLTGGWFAQPQMQLSWLRSQQQELRTDRNTRIDLEQGSNLDLRTGLMIGKTGRQADKAYQLYGKLHRLQTLHATNNVTVNETHLNSLKEGGAWNVGAGLQVSGKATSFHLDLETGLGSSDVKQNWGINFGVRWMF